MIVCRSSIGAAVGSLQTVTTCRWQVGQEEEERDEKETRVFFDVSVLIVLWGSGSSCRRRRGI